MKKIPLFLGCLVSVIFLTVGTSCDSDEPVVDSEDVFIPYTGPIEPLSQELRPTLTEGKRWIRKNYIRWGNQFFDTIDVSEYIYGDTIVDGISAKKMITFFNGYSHGYQSVAREESGIVYYYWYGIKSHVPVREFLFEYDVNPSAGKTIKTPLMGSVSIISKGTIVLMGKTRRAVKVSCQHYSSPQEYDYWVEGIGSLFGMIPNYTYVTTLNAVVILYSQLLQCYDGDEKIYDYREFSHDLYQPIEEFSYENQ